MAVFVGQISQILAIVALPDSQLVEQPNLMLP